jgi:hypothetical protein
MGQSATKPCPVCNKPMVFALAPGGDRRVFRCLDCDQADPLESEIAKGWLHGELGHENFARQQNETAEAHLLGVTRAARRSTPGIAKGVNVIEHGSSIVHAALDPTKCDRLIRPTRRRAPTK